jgi:hypothetical protein
MNELDLLVRMRAEVPLADPSPSAECAVLAGVRARAAKHSARQRVALLVRTKPLVLAATAAAVVVAAASVGFAATRNAPAAYVFSWSGRPTASAPAAAGGVGRAHTEAQLVEFASRNATASPGKPPAPTDWIYIKTEVASSSAGSGGFLFGPPNERRINLQWIRADWREYAAYQGSIPADLPAGTVVHGHIGVSPGGGGGLGGWKSVSYSYLNSLPTDPARLEAIILADNNPRMPWYAKPKNIAIFEAIATLLTGQEEGVWIPPRLGATMYRVLQSLPGVHFDPTTDLAGRTGLGLYMVIDGWYKHELVINPATYAFMGDKEVAVTAHKNVSTDGTRYIKKGQVLGWEALLDSAIVSRVGQVP